MYQASLVSEQLAQANASTMNSPILIGVSVVGQLVMERCSPKMEGTTKCNARRLAASEAFQSLVFYSSWALVQAEA